MPSDFVPFSACWFCWLQLLEGLQSSLTISKIPSVSHDKGHKSLIRTASRGKMLPEDFYNLMLAISSLLWCVLCVN